MLTGIFLLQFVQR